MGRNVQISDLADAIMETLEDYADLAAEDVKQAVREAGETVRDENRYQLAHLLEFGHAKRGGGRVSAQPHIAAAEAKGMEQLEDEIRKALEG